MTSADPSNQISKPANLANSAVAAGLNAFRWEPQPRAFAWLMEKAERLLANLPEAKAWADRLSGDSGNRFVDLIDAVYPATEADLQGALDTGWERAESMHGYQIYRNPLGVFPQVVTPEKGPCGKLGIDVKVESIEDFFTANSVFGPVYGTKATRYRWACIADLDADGDGDGHGYSMGIAERLGFNGVGGSAEPVDLNAVDEALTLLRGRQRDSATPDDDAAAFAASLETIDQAVALVGPDVACALFFRAEREFWHARNNAARAQYHRQQRVGIGWANHDHHTYRSSRAGYQPLIEGLEKLGLFCRERFYPGPEAGWGAQVLEQEKAGIVVFADVDMSPEEIKTDFAHLGLPVKAGDRLATVGLWCALHGESFLGAGMHHLECQFDFTGLAEQLKAESGIGMLNPFSNFPYLKQQFTDGHWWPVTESRVAWLEKANRITAEEAARFRKDGAIGSHLENLERNDGFKGFNQTGIDSIIAETDPRLQSAGV